MRMPQFLALRLLGRGLQYVITHPRLCLYPIVNTILILSLGILCILPLHHQEAALLRLTNPSDTAYHTLWILLGLLTGLGLLAHSLHLWTQLALTIAINQQFQHKPIGFIRSAMRAVPYLPALWLAKLYHIGLYMRRAWVDDDSPLALACGTQPTFLLTHFTYSAVLTGIIHPRQQLNMIREYLDRTWGTHLLLSGGNAWLIACIEIAIIYIVAIHMDFQQIASQQNIYSISIGAALIWFVRNAVGLHIRLLRTALFYFAEQHIAPSPFTADELQRTLKPHPFQRNR